MNEFRAGIVIRQAESAANPSLSDVSSNTSLQEQIAPHRFPLQAQNSPYVFKMRIPVFVSDVPAPLGTAPTLPYSSSSSLCVAYNLTYWYSQNK
ncbi:hypothetical protein A0J61_09717 [Choanephora cucurbitarum]|uniref:Uncharacterized protein n=1 Tax=Choanephora cucurbitarum TaxID=101091 RepID=A0A1C7MZI7_9FUNG|nr:hypothetical protein A0J61_09717 [Choanephora cucurbitarum]